MENEETTYPLWKGVSYPVTEPVLTVEMIERAMVEVCRGNSFLEKYYLPPRLKATIKYRKRYHKRGLKMKGK